MCEAMPAFASAKVGGASNVTYNDLLDFGGTAHGVMPIC